MYIPNSCRTILDHSDIVAVFRNCGLDGILLTLYMQEKFAVDSSHEVLVILSDRQYILWILREVCVLSCNSFKIDALNTSVIERQENVTSSRIDPKISGIDGSIASNHCQLECENMHLNALIKWFMWLLSSTVEFDSKLIVQNANYVPFTSKPHSTNLNTPSNHAIKVFCDVPPVPPRLSVLSRLLVLQEVRLLLSAPALESKVNIKQFSSVLPPSLTSIPCAIYATQAGLPSIREETITSLDSSSQTDKFDCLDTYATMLMQRQSLVSNYYYNAPASCEAIRFEFFQIGFLDLIYRIVFGNLCHPGIVKLCFNSDSSVDDVSSARLTVLAVEEWWNGLAVFADTVAASTGVEKDLSVGEMFRTAHTVLTELSNFSYLSESKDRKPSFHSKFMDIILQMLVDCNANQNVSPYAMVVPKLPRNSPENLEVSLKSTMLRLFSRSSLSNLKVLLVDSLCVDGSIVLSEGSCADSLVPTFLSPAYYILPRALSSIINIVKPCNIKLFSYFIDEATANDMGVTNSILSEIREANNQFPSKSLKEFNIRPISSDRLSNIKPVDVSSCTVSKASSSNSNFLSSPWLSSWSKTSGKSASANDTESTPQFLYENSLSLESIDTSIHSIHSMTSVQSNPNLNQLVLNSVNGLSFNRRRSISQMSSVTNSASSAGTGMYLNNFANGAYEQWEIDSSEKTSTVGGGSLHSVLALSNVLLSQNSTPTNSTAVSVNGDAYLPNNSITGHYRSQSSVKTMISNASNSSKHRLTQNTVTSEFVSIHQQFFQSCYELILSSPFPPIVNGRSGVTHSTEESDSQLTMSCFSPFLFSMVWLSNNHINSQFIDKVLLLLHHCLAMKLGISPFFLESEEDFNPHLNHSAPTGLGSQRNSNAFEDSQNNLTTVYKLMLKKHLMLFLNPMLSQMSSPINRRNRMTSAVYLTSPLTQIVESSLHCPMVTNSHAADYFSIQIRGREHAHMILTLILDLYSPVNADSPVAVNIVSQQHLITNISSLIVGNPLNAVLLLSCEEMIIKLIDCITKIHDGVALMMLSSLIAQILQQHITPNILRKLLNTVEYAMNCDDKFNDQTSTCTAMSLPRPNGVVVLNDYTSNRDLSITLFQIIGKLAERPNPTSFFHFKDKIRFPVDSSTAMSLNLSNLVDLDLPKVQLPKFPFSTQTGVSIAMWIQVGSMSDPSSSSGVFVQLQFNNQQAPVTEAEAVTMSLFFRSIYRLTGDSSTPKTGQSPNTPTFSTISPSDKLGSESSKRVLQLCVSISNQQSQSFIDCQSEAMSIDKLNLVNSVDAYDEVDTSNGVYGKKAATWKEASRGALELASDYMANQSTTDNANGVTEDGVDTDIESEISLLTAFICSIGLPSMVIDYDWTELGKWHLLCLTIRDKSKFDCYIDGVQYPVLYWTPLGYKYDDELETLIANHITSQQQHTEDDFDNLRASRHQRPSTAGPTFGNDAAPHMSHQFGTTYREAHTTSPHFFYSHNTVQSNLQNIDVSETNPAMLTLGGCQHELLAYSTLSKSLNALYFRLVSHQVNDPSDQDVIASIESKFQLILWLLNSFISCAYGFSGSIGQVVVFDGMVEIDYMMKQLNYGPFIELPSISALPQKLSIIDSIHPKNYHRFEESSDDVSRCVFSKHTYLVTKTQSLLSTLQQLGGFKLLYFMLTKDQITQVATLRVLTSLMKQGFELYDQLFVTSQTHLVIRYCLLHSIKLTSTETVQVLLDTMVYPSYVRDRNHVNISKSSPVTGASVTQQDLRLIEILDNQILFELVIDVIISSQNKPELARATLDWLSSVCNDVPINCKHVLHVSGLTPLLILLSVWSTVPDDTFQSIKSLRDQPLGTETIGDCKSNEISHQQSSSHATSGKSKLSSLNTTPRRSSKSNASSKLPVLADVSHNQIQNPSFHSAADVKIEADIMVEPMNRLRSSTAKLLRTLLIGTNGQHISYNIQDIIEMHSVPKGQNFALPTGWSPQHFTQIMNYSLQCIRLSKSTSRSLIDISSHLPANSSNTNVDAPGSAASTHSLSHNATNLRKITRIRDQFSHSRDQRTREPSEDQRTREHEINVLKLKLASLVSTSNLLLDMIISAVEGSITMSTSMLSLLKHSYAFTNWENYWFLLIELFALSPSSPIKVQAIKLLGLSFYSIDNNGDCDSKLLQLFNEKFNGFLLLGRYFIQQNTELSSSHPSASKPSVSETYTTSLTFSDQEELSIIESFLGLMYWKCHSPSAASASANTHVSSNSSIPRLLSIPVLAKNSPDSRRNSWNRKDQMKNTISGMKENQMSSSMSSLANTNSSATLGSGSTLFSVFSWGSSTASSSQASQGLTSKRLADVPMKPIDRVDQVSTECIIKGADYAFANSVSDSYDNIISDSDTTTLGKSLLIPLTSTDDSLAFKSRSTSSIKFPTSIQPQQSDISSSQTEGLSDRKFSTQLVKSVVEVPKFSAQTLAHESTRSAHVDMIVIPNVLETMFCILQLFKSSDVFRVLANTVEKSITLSQSTLASDDCIKTIIENLRRLVSHADLLSSIIDCIRVQLQRLRQEQQVHVSYMQRLQRAQPLPTQLSACDEFGDCDTLSMHSVSAFSDNDTDLSGMDSELECDSSSLHSVNTVNQHQLTRPTSIHSFNYEVKYSQIISPMIRLIRVIIIQDIILQPNSLHRYWREVFNLCDTPETSEILLLLAIELITSVREYYHSKVTGHVTSTQQGVGLTVSETVHYIIDQVAHFLLQLLDKISDFPLEFCVRILQAIHLFNYECPPEIRKRIQATPLQQVRHDFILYLILDRNNDLYVKTAALNEIRHISFQSYFSASLFNEASTTSISSSITSTLSTTLSSSVASSMSSSATSSASSIVSVASTKAVSDQNVLNTFLLMFVEACEDLEFITRDIESSEPKAGQSTYNSTQVAKASDILTRPRVSSATIENSDITLSLSPSSSYFMNSRGSIDPSILQSSPFSQVNFGSNSTSVATNPSAVNLPQTAVNSNTAAIDYTASSMSMSMSVVDRIQTILDILQVIVSLVQSCITCSSDCKKFMIKLLADASTQKYSYVNDTDVELKRNPHQVLTRVFVDCFQSSSETAAVNSNGFSQNLAGKTMGPSSSSSVIGNSLWTIKDTSVIGNAKTDNQVVVSSPQSVSEPVVLSSDSNATVKSSWWGSLVSTSSTSAVSSAAIGALITVDKDKFDEVIIDINVSSASPPSSTSMSEQLAQYGQVHEEDTLVGYTQTETGVEVDVSKSYQAVDSMKSHGDSFLSDTSVHPNITNSNAKSLDGKSQNIVTQSAPSPSPSVDNISEFLDWYFSPENKSIQQYLRNKILKESKSSLKQVDKHLDRVQQKKQKFRRQIHDKLCKDKSKHEKLLRELSEKMKSSNDKITAVCQQDTDLWMSRLYERLKTGQESYTRDLSALFDHSNLAGA